MSDRVITCGICYHDIRVVRYAIRDMTPNETAWAWWWRHVMGFFTVGLVRRKFATIIPICESCVEIRR